MSRIVVLDTNVLLADPNVLLAFPWAEIVIPETVLGELDKLKTARVDPDLRFRGREVSRLLFELSEDGSLIEGVELPDGGSLRIATLDTDAGLPDGLTTRNADEKILATAFQVCTAAEPDCEVTLVTNDLNMLLKAQTYGVNVQRHGEGVEGGFARRFIIRPFQRYRIPLTILAIALAVFAAILVIVSNTGPGTTSTTLPPEFKQLLSDNQQAALDNLTTLQNNPGDSEALLGMARYYYDLAAQALMANDRSSQLRYAQPGVRYYRRYLEVVGDDANARADYASLLFYSGETDEAIQQIAKVLATQPNHILANFNLGVILMNGRNDLQGAREQFVKVVQLAGDSQDNHSTRTQAQTLIAQINVTLGGSGQSTQSTTQ